MIKISKFGIIFLIGMVVFLGGCNFFTMEIQSEKNATSDNPTFVSDGDKGLQILLCLEAKGTRMYGSITCGHCANQKKSLGEKAEAEFGRVYIECNSQAENTQMWECVEKNIEGYPTWIFADGFVKRGFTEPAKLQELSGCTDDVLENY